MDKKLIIRKYSLLTMLAIFSLLIAASCKSNQKNDAQAEDASANTLALTGELAKKDSVWPAAAQQALDTYNTQKKAGTFGIGLITSGSPVSEGQTLILFDGESCDVYRVEPKVQAFPVGTNQFKKVKTHKKNDASYTTCLELAKRPPLTSKQSKYFGGIQYELHYFKNDKTIDHEFFGPFYIASTKDLAEDQQKLVDYISSIISL